MTHGYFDETLSLESVRDAVDELRSVGLPVMYREINKEREADDEHEISMIAEWLKSKSRADAIKKMPRPEIHVPAAEPDDEGSDVLFPLVRDIY